MMYMDDAIRATLELMQAPAENLTIRSAYNLAGLSFTPKDISKIIKSHIPEFEITYNPDYRQAIADSWPSSIDDSAARKDWNWKTEFDLEKTSKAMLNGLKES